MALSIAKPKHRSLINPSLVHLFSSSPHQDAPNSPSQSPSEEQQQQTSPSSYFNQIRANFKQPQNQQSQQHQPNNSSGDSASFDDIKKSLSGFRSRSTTDPPSNAAGQQNPTSFQELYRRHANVKPGMGTVTTQSSPNNNLKGTMDAFETIKETMRQLKANTPPKTGTKSGDPSAFSSVSDTFKFKREGENGQLKSNVIGGMKEIPFSMFAKKEQVTGKDNMDTDFVKMYSMDELGKKLMDLRPESKGEKGWFSLEELKERLVKLRTMDVDEIKKLSGIPIQELRNSLKEMQKDKKDSIQRLNILGQLGQPEFMAYPPKEHLVDKYFHPDNMSSAEKLKLELSKVRDEFKMSESDCGSARVQVAQLTTKIKHLSSLLHKKDKHSRKGLQEMVQRRKKLLKYLRRTDWDSYCLVLSKLGLRDNTEMKLGVDKKTGQTASRAEKQKKLKQKKSKSSVNRTVPTPSAT